MTWMVVVAQFERRPTRFWKRVAAEWDHPSLDLARGHHCPHGAHRCAVYDLFYGREVGEISLFLQQPYTKKTLGSHALWKVRLKPWRLKAGIWLNPAISTVQARRGAAGGMSDKKASSLSCRDNFFDCLPESFGLLKVDLLISDQSLDCLLGSCIGCVRWLLHYV